MPDMLDLDKKYFIDNTVFNCPFCHRGNVSYVITAKIPFDWNNKKICWVYIAKCLSCGKRSMHLSYDDFDIFEITIEYKSYYRFYSELKSLDTKIFYSVPTSYFTIDNRIHEEIRELITEAEGCLKSNFLTGASACARKAIYEVTVKEGVEGKDYEEKIKALKPKYPQIDTELFDTLAHIQGMTSDKLHEESWGKWDSKTLRFLLEVLKAVLHEMYVLPKEKKERSVKVLKLKEELEKNKEKKGKSKESEKDNE